MNREKLNETIKNAIVKEASGWLGTNYSAIALAVTDAILPHLRQPPDLSKRQRFDKPDDSSVRWWFVAKNGDVLLAIKQCGNDIINYNKQNGIFAASARDHSPATGDYYPADQDIPWPTAPPKPKALPPLPTAVRKSDGTRFYVNSGDAHGSTHANMLIREDGLWCSVSCEALARDYTIIEQEGA